MCVCVSINIRAPHHRQYYRGSLSIGSGRIMKIFYEIRSANVYILFYMVEKYRYHVTFKYNTKQLFFMIIVVVVAAL